MRNEGEGRREKGERKLTVKGRRGGDLTRVNHVLDIEQ